METLKDVPTIKKTLKEFQDRGYDLAECLAYIEKGNGMTVEEWFEQKELSVEEYKKIMNDEKFSNPGRFSGDVVNLDLDE